MVAPWKEAGFGGLSNTAERQVTLYFFHLLAKPCQMAIYFCQMATKCLEVTVTRNADLCKHHQGTMGGVGGGIVPRGQAEVFPLQREVAASITGGGREKQQKVGPFSPSEILLDRPASPREIIDEVRHGLPVSVVERLTERLELGAPVVNHLIGLSDRTYARRRKEQSRLDPIQSDRAYRIARIAARAEEVFEDEALAHDWLKSPNRALGVAPLELLDTETGTELVLDVLGRIEHGVYS